MERERLERMHECRLLWYKGFVSSKERGINPVAWIDELTDWLTDSFTHSILFGKKAIEPPRFAKERQHFFWKRWKRNILFFCFLPLSEQTIWLDKSCYHLKAATLFSICRDIHLSISFSSNVLSYKSNSMAELSSADFDPEAAELDLVHLYFIGYLSCFPPSHESRTYQKKHFSYIALACSNIVRNSLTSNLGL